MKKITAIFVFLSMILPLLASCKKLDTVTNIPSDDDSNRVERPVEETLYTERDKVDDELPEKNYEGAEFKIFARDRSDFVTEIGVNLEQSEEVVSNAILVRNKAIEDRFNVKLVATHVKTPNTEIKAMVQSGLDECDLFVDHVLDTANVAIQGVFYNIDELEYVNLEKPWYIKSATEAVSVGDKSYLLAGDYCLSIYWFTYCMLFNKKFVANYNLEDPYKVVEEGRWTIDYISEVVKGLYDDLDGNGVRNENDQFGFSSDYNSAAVTFQYAFDNPVMKKNADGIPELNYNTPKMVSIVERMYSFFYENEGSWVGTWGTPDKLFSSGNAYLRTALFSTAGSLRDNEMEFGILPYPKYDQDQKEYYTMVDGAHSIMAVPTTADPERASIIIEALNAESYKKVIPAYYETELKVKGARGDDQAAKVLDIISHGVTFDFGYIYNRAGGVAAVFSVLMQKQSKNFSSEYDKVEKSAIKAYNKVIEKYQKLD